MKSDTKKKYYEFTEMKSDINEIKKIFTHMMGQKQHYSPGKMDAPKAQDTDTVEPTNEKSPRLEGGNYTKSGGVWTLKHDILPPKFYEILIKTEIKGDTSLYLKKFYKHTKMCLNVVTRLREKLLPSY